jgi:hypothetical protein
MGNAVRKLPVAIVAIAIGCCAFAPAPAAAPISYDFALIADTSGAFSGFGSSVSINNAGTVAFNAGLDAGGIGFFTGSGGPITTIADSNGPISTFTGGVAVINDSGTVAFFATLDTGVRGIFAGNGGPLTTIADASGAFGTGFGFTPSINNAGTVAFSATLDAGGQGIFIGSGGATTTISSVPGPVLLGPLLSDPAINDAGMVAFRARHGASCPPACIFSIFTGDGGPLTTIATTGSGGGFTILGSPPAINDAGTVAFRGSNPLGGVFTGTGGPTMTIADSSGPLNIVLANHNVAINDIGTVALLANLDAGGDCILTGPDVDDDVVICQGDALFGSTIGHPTFSSLTTGNLGFFRDGLNDDGELAFWARLVDGRQVVGRATPSGVPPGTVPEPHALILLVAGLLGMGLLGRRRER